MCFIISPGGDQIYGIFDYRLPSALRKLPFDRHLSIQNIRRVVSEADGYQPHLVAPEQGYRRLIDSALNFFRDPAEALVDAELVRRSIAETQELKRFPTLHDEFAAVANELLERFREDGMKTTLRLVDMESAYLTVDFLWKLPQEAEKTGNQAVSCSASEGHFRRIGLNVSSYIGMVSETLRSTIPKSVDHCQVREAKLSLLDSFYAQLSRKEGKRFAQLLDEDPELMEKRIQYAKRLELYESARDEIDLVSWSR